MEVLHYEVQINASAAAVWAVMLSDETYREWTAAFHEGSHFVGGWATGETIRFLGPDDNGSLGGMVGFIDESRPEEFVSIEYTGLVDGGVDDRESEFAKKVVGTHENYTFTESDGVTTVGVDIESIDEFVEMFEQSWPGALASLKRIAERAAR